MASSREPVREAVQRQVEATFHTWRAGRDAIQAQFDLELRKLEDDYRNSRQAVEAEFIRGMRVVGAAGGVASIQMFEQVMADKKNVKFKLIESDIQDRRNKISTHFNKELLAHDERFSGEILNVLKPGDLSQSSHPQPDAISSSRLPPSPNHSLSGSFFGRPPVGSNADGRPLFTDHVRQSSQPGSFQGLDYPRPTPQPRPLHETDFVRGPPQQRRPLRDEYVPSAGPERQQTRWINTTNPSSMGDGRVRHPLPGHQKILPSSSMMGDHDGVNEKINAFLHASTTSPTVLWQLANDEKAKRKADGQKDQEPARRTRMWPESSPRTKPLPGIQGTPLVDKPLASTEAEKVKPPTPKSAQKTQAVKRTIDFNEVYQDGDAEYKHIIISYPAGEKFDWYILKCDEHGVHFNLNPLHGAAKHLHSSQHNNMSKEHALAIQELGHMVWDCTKELADKNNAAVKEAFANGYKPFNRNQLTKTERRSMGFPVPETVPARRSQGTIPAPRRKERIADNVHNPLTSPGIYYPVPGELYLGYWSKNKTRYAVMVLPWGSLECVGVGDTLKATGLTLVQNKPPKCYVIDRETREILGWAEGYEDGGKLVSKREFPVMYFDHTRSVGWMAGKDLSPFDFEDPNALKLIPHYEIARDSYAAARPEKFENYQKMKEYYAAKGLPPKLISDVQTPIVDKSHRGLTEKNPGIGESERPNYEAPDGVESPNAGGRVYGREVDIEMADASRGEATDTSHDSDRDNSPDTDDDVEMTNAESRRTSVSNKGVAREINSSTKETVDKDTIDVVASNGDTTVVADESDNADRVDASASNSQTTENADRIKSHPANLLPNGADGSTANGTESHASVVTSSGPGVVFGFHSRNSSTGRGRSHSPNSATEGLGKLNNGTVISPSSERTEDSIVLPPRETTVTAAQSQPDTHAEAPMTAATPRRAEPKTNTPPSTADAPVRPPTAKDHGVVHSDAEAARRLSESSSSISSPRSISPVPLAAEMTSRPVSRTTTPTVVHPAETAQASRWRVIRSESGPGDSSPSSPKTREERPTASAPPNGISSPAVSAKSLPSADAPAAAPVGTTQPRSRTNTPLSTQSSTGDLFEIAYYEDDTGGTFHQQDAGRTLRMAIDKTTNTCETNPADQGVSVKIDPHVVTRVEVNPLSDGPGAPCVVTIESAKGTTPRTQELVFEAGSIMGREEGGRIHARRLCGWIKRVNAAIDYRNHSYNSNRPATKYIRT